MKRSASAGLALVAFVVVAFGVNAAVRLPCHDVCGSDIGRLYAERGIDRAHPPFFDRDLEYPPLIGVVMYAAGVPFDGGLRASFLLNAVILTALAAATTWMLWRRYGNATRRWALAPPLLVEGLTNWDLLAVAPATMGLLQWEADRALLAGVLLGVGAAAKLFPALYVPILVAGCAPSRMWRSARGLVAGLVIGMGAVMIPVYLGAPHALGYFLRFHADRAPSRGTIWFYAFRDFAMKPWAEHETVVHVTTVVTTVLLAVAIVVLVAPAARGRIAPLAACALATIAFILTNKIYSPQYDLWLVPFLVMVPVRTKLVVHFYVSSFCVWTLTAAAPSIIGSPGSLYLVEAVVAYRLVMLVLLARAFWVPEPRADPPDWEGALRSETRVPG